MSDENVNLEFLGEQMRRMQGDLRIVRTDQIRQEGELRSLDAKMDQLDAKVDHLDAKVDHLDAKVDRVESRLEAKIDNFAASVDARFEQVNQTMATNLQLLLTAINSGRR